MTVTTRHGIPIWTRGDRLRKAREAAGMHQAQMAELLDVNRNTIGNYEGDRTSPTTLALRAWADVTGVPFEWLKDGTFLADDPDVTSWLLPPAFALAG